MFRDVVLSRMPYARRVSDSLLRAMTTFCATDMEVTILILEGDGCVSMAPLSASVVFEGSEVHLKPNHKQDKQVKILKAGSPAIMLAVTDNGARGEALMRGCNGIFRLRGAKEMIACAADLLRREHLYRPQTCAQ